MAVLYNGDWTKVNLIRPFPKDQTPMIDVNLCVHSKCVVLYNDTYFTAKRWGWTL